MKNYINNHALIRIAGMVILFLFLISSLETKAQHHGNPEELFENLKLQEGNWVADVGSSSGRYTFAMSSKVGNTGHVFAVDIDDNALDELQENIVERNANNVTPVFSIPGNPMLPVNSLDAVLVRNTYHEFTRYMGMLRQIRQSLKSDGRLIISDSITDDLKDESRDEQTDHHKIKMEFVKNELIGAGYKIEKEDKNFFDSGNHRHWLIVATLAQ